MSKVAIPPPQLGELKPATYRTLSSLKENVDRMQASMTQLPSTATLADVITKLNTLIAQLTT